LRFLKNVGRFVIDSTISFDYKKTIQENVNVIYFLRASMTMSSSAF